MPSKTRGIILSSSQYGLATHIEEFPFFFWFQFQQFLHGATHTEELVFAFSFRHLPILHDVITITMASPGIARHRPGHLIQLRGGFWKSHTEFWGPGGGVKRARAEPCAARRPEAGSTQATHCFTLASRGSTGPRGNPRRSPVDPAWCQKRLPSVWGSAFWALGNLKQLRGSHGGSRTNLATWGAGSFPQNASPLGGSRRGP